MGLHMAVHALNVGNIAHEITVSYNLIDFKFATSWKRANMLLQNFHLQVEKTKPYKRKYHFYEYYTH